MLRFCARVLCALTLFATPAFAQGAPLGDVNGDNQINVLDIQNIINQALLVSPVTAAADLNGDNNVNVLDVQQCINIALGIMPPPALSQAQVLDVGRFEVFFELPEAGSTLNAAIILTELPRNSAVVFMLSEAVDPQTVTPVQSVQLLTDAQDERASFDLLPDSGASAGLLVDPAQRGRILTVKAIDNPTGTFGSVFFEASPNGLLSAADGLPLIGAHTEATPLVDVATGFVFDWVLADPDTVAPSIVESTPAAGETIQSNSGLRLRFSETVAPASVLASLLLTDDIGPVGGTLRLEEPRLDGFRFTPSRLIVGTLVVDASAVTDLAGNPFGASAVFSLAVGVDRSAPKLELVTLNGIPFHLNGGDAAGGGAGPNGGRLRVLPTGFTIDIEVDDAGGAGLSGLTSDVSVVCDRQVGTSLPGTNLVPLLPSQNVVVTNDAVHLLIPSNMNFSVLGSNAITVTVADAAGNVSAPKVFRFDCAVSNDAFLPLEGPPETWHLVARDFDTHDLSGVASYVINAPQSSTPDGLPDLEGDLLLYGLGSTAGATALVHSSTITVNAAAQNFLLSRTLFHMSLLYGHDVAYEDAASKNPGFDRVLTFAPKANEGVNIRFVFSDTDPGIGFNRMGVGGFGAALGVAEFDPLNRAQVTDNGASATTNDFGIFLATEAVLNYDGSPPRRGSAFEFMFGALSPFSGGIGNNAPASRGVPVGEDAADVFVLSPVSDPASFDAPTLARYQTVLRALDVVARHLAVTTAHEIGHSLGLVATGAPFQGLYGGTILNSGSSSGHIDLSERFAGVGINVMATSGALVADQSPATRFNLLNRAYLENKLMITAAFDNP